MTAARIPALLAGLVAGVCWLTACGVPTSGVVAAGEPATGLPPEIEVYFLAGDRLVAVPRQAPGGPDVVTAVQLLFAGPVEAEAGQVRTELPRLKQPPAIAVDGDRLHVSLPQGSGSPTMLAQEQLACTVARTSFGARLAPTAGETPGIAVPPRLKRVFDIRFEGPGWEVDLGPGACPLSGR